MSKDEDNKKLLEAQIGNLEVQVAEYQQIIQELSEKLEQYQKRYGIVFKKNLTQDNQK